MVNGSGQFQTQFRFLRQGPDPPNAIGMVSLKTQLVPWIQHNFPGLEPQVSFEFESTQKTTFVTLDLGIKTSSTVANQIQAQIDRLQIDPGVILVYSVATDQNYPHEWLYSILDFLQINLEIDALYLLELYQSSGLELNLNPDQKPIWVSTDGTNLLLHLSQPLQSRDFDINTFLNSLILKTSHRLAEIWERGLVRIPPNRTFLISNWNLEPVQSPLPSFPLSDLYQPRTQLKIQTLLSLINGSEWVSWVYSLNPVQRHFIARKYPATFEFRSAVGISKIWLEVPKDVQGWKWYQETQRGLEECISEAMGEVETFTYATRDVAEIAAGADGVIYPIRSLDFPYLVSFLQTLKIQPQPGSASTWAKVGFQLQILNINEYTRAVLSLQSQITYLLYKYFGVIPSSYKIYKQFVGVPLTLLIPLIGGKPIQVSSQIWSQIYFKFDPNITVVGYGPYGHRVAQLILNPSLRIYADRVECASSEIELVQEFQQIFKALFNSQMTTIQTNYDGVDLLPELAPSFDFKISYRSQLFSLISSDQPQLTSSWVNFNTDRIRNNLMPLWRVSGPWTNDSDLSQVVLEAASIFAFVELVSLHPELNNFAGQIRVSSDGSVEVPVFTSKQGMEFQLQLARILEDDLQVQLAESWEDALQIRLSGEGRIIIQVRSDYYVVSRTPFGPALEKTLLINQLLDQVSICREGKDPVQDRKFDQMSLEELMTVIVQEGEDPWCLMADSVRFENINTQRFLTQVNLNPLVMRGVYSGIVPGLLPILFEEIYPTTGKIRLETTPTPEGYLEVIAILKTPETELNLYQFIFDPENIELEGVEDLLNMAWNQGLLWNSWGKHLYKTLGQISRAPAIRAPNLVRNSPDMSLQFLAVLDRLL